MKKHPIQPLITDEHGILRFKKNKIVDYLVEQVGLNKLATMDFPAEDWDQLAQLIGYSHSGSPSYLKDETWRAAQAIHEGGVSEAEARNEALRGILAEVADSLVQASDCFDLLNKVRDDYGTAPEVCDERG